jgi:hypothetical protein
MAERAATGAGKRAAAVRRRAAVLLAGLRAQRAQRAFSAEVNRGAETRADRAGVGWLALLRPRVLLKYARDLPVSVAPGAAFLLAERPVARSKAAAVLGDLTAAGARVIVPDTLAPGLAAEGRRLRLALRGWRRLAGLRPGRRRLPAEDVAFVVAATLARDLCAAHPGLVPVAISDLSERRIALATGAGMAGSRSLWWQIDYPVQPIPRLGFTHAAVRSGPGLEAATAAGLIPAAIPAAPPAPVAAPERLGTLGLAPNALPAADLIARAAVLRAALGAGLLRLRLHPRDAGAWVGALPPGIELAPRGEDLAVFCAQADAVICGNSAVQLMVLLHGRAAIHVGGLDWGGADYYGYVAKGLVFGLPEGGVPDPGEVAAHYARPATQEAIRAMIMLPPDAGIATLALLAQGLAPAGPGARR